MRQKLFTDILIFISVFISSITFFNEPFEGYLHYIIFILLLPVFMFRFGFPGQPLKILAIPFLVGVLQIGLGNNTWELFLKIFMGMFLSITFYFYVVRYYGFNIRKIFRYYLKGAYIVAVIGLVQFIAFHLKITPAYNFSWIFNKWGIVYNQFGIRINSVFSEASQCAIVLSPACFVAIYNLIPGNRFEYSRFKSAVILVTFILTTSSTGYLGLFIIVFLLMLNYGRISIFIVGLIVMFAGASILYNNVDEFKVRVDTSIGLWSDENLTVENMNSSSFVLYNNYHIATENFKQNFLTGSGLGSHSVAFDNYSLTRLTGFLDIKFNKADANSMLLRLISETGLIGIIFIIWFIFKHFVRKKSSVDSELWVISSSMFVIIMLYFLRQGNYFLNGFPLYMWLYYYTRKEYEAQLEGETNLNEEEVEEERELSGGDEKTEEDAGAELGTPYKTPV
jgi:hypothetical protein